MIIDSLTGLERYFALNPHFEKIFKFLRRQPLHELAEGCHEIDGKHACLTVMTCEGKDLDEVRLETHDSYIDIHIPLEGCETIGWRDRAHCEQAAGSYDEAGDIAFYDDPVEVFVSPEPMSVVIIFPHDAHAPLIGQGTIKKIVAKVSIV